jgi:hypothetical protein
MGTIRRNFLKCDKMLKYLDEKVEDNMLRYDEFQ